MNTFCPYFNQKVCKSCELIESDYADQIMRKEMILQNELSPLEHPGLLPTITSATVNFRNKAKLVVTGTLEDPVIGLWGEDNLDQGRELLDCPLHVKEINNTLPFIKEFIKHIRLPPYQISSKKGELKGVIIFYSEQSQKMYLRFILRSKEAIDRIQKHLSFLTDKCPALECVSVNIQPIAHAILEGEEEIFITPNKSIEHRLSNISLSLGPRAFVQTNQEMAEKLYFNASTWVKESKLQRFMELYCGQGAFSFFCAPYIKEGLGIEINPDAVLEANNTANKYNHPHLKFKSADAGSVKNEITEFSPEIILVNPPRRGLTEACDLLLEQSPEMIIYSSCNYKTLVNDLRKLAAKYEIKRTQIYDMFPHTSHFETLVELRLKKSIHFS